MNLQTLKQALHIHDQIKELDKLIADIYALAKLAAEGKESKISITIDMPEVKERPATTDESYASYSPHLGYFSPENYDPFKEMRAIFGRRPQGSSNGNKELQLTSYDTLTLQVLGVIIADLEAKKRNFIHQLSQLGIQIETS
jgi:hypothetical protein